MKVQLKVNLIDVWKLTDNFCRCYETLRKDWFTHLAWKLVLFLITTKSRRISWEFTECSFYSKQSGHSKALILVIIWYREESPVSPEMVINWWILCRKTFTHIDSRDMSSSLNVCFIIEYPRKHAYQSHCHTEKRSSNCWIMNENVNLIKSS